MQQSTQHRSSTTTSKDNPFASLLFEPCDAYAVDPLYPSVHTCIDPARCAVEYLIAGPDPRDAEIERLNYLLDTVEAFCEDSKAKLAQTILAEIHTQRGGPA